MIANEGMASFAVTYGTLTCEMIRSEKLLRLTAHVGQLPFV